MSSPVIGSSVTVEFHRLNRVFDEEGAKVVFANREDDLRPDKLDTDNLAMM